eukprot:Tbor_TRINITY_DN5442_c1_g16::TRINITY_DN5442_c1_g16_i1::g.25142::m.25142/K07575/K07575; PUA domain protein
MKSISGLMTKFTSAEIISAANTGQSAQKRVRSELAEQFPGLEAEHWEELMPKKTDITLVKCKNDILLITIQREPKDPKSGANAPANKPEILFFQHLFGVYIPELHVLHQYPNMLSNKVHRVDIGGCKFILSGANIMCPGLTSEGGEVGDNIDNGEVCAVYVEGKKHAVAVGVATMSSEEIRSINSGICIQNVHFLGDNLWLCPFLK